MIKHQGICLIKIIIFLQINSVCSLCKMPTAWLGSWYQRGMNSLLDITTNHIQTKGLCLNALPMEQYYLFSDRSNRCIRCLLFIERHANLLQYRESDCIDTDDLEGVTSCPNMIAPDAALYTLHRNNSKPQSCPIQSPFIITHLIKDGTMCHQSMAPSYINECAHDYQFHLRLTPCLPYQSIIDLQFVCVGTWVEDFHTFFVARIQSHAKNQYACFRFLTKQKSSKGLLLNMATDDSCHDLYSKQMSTVMTLSSKTYIHKLTNDTNQLCSFPIEYQSSEWYSLNRTIRMTINSNDIELNGLNLRFHCQKSMISENSLHIYRIKTYKNCHFKDECLRLIQHTKHTLEISTINLSEDETCDFTTNQDLNIRIIFVTESNENQHACPSYMGNLIYQSNTDYYLKRNLYHMSIGCKHKQKLIVSQNENDIEPHRSVIAIDTCITSWISDDLLINYLLIQSKYSHEYYCLSFQMTHPIIIRNNSNDCFSNDYDKSIFIYSAYMRYDCSLSEKLSFKHSLLILTIVIIVSLL